MTHQIGFIGLGKMGKNMVLHLLEQGIEVVAYNRTREKTDELKQEVPQVTIAYTIQDLVSQLPAPRIVWLMVPNGQPVDDVLHQLISFGIQKGDIVIDGGNTYYKDTVRRAKELAAKGITYLDCGTSGGLTGARNGACLMVGGEPEAVKTLDWLWKAAAVKDGFGYFGPSGAGHFVKMVHNGVEYGMNQAIGEGFEILSKGPYTLDFSKVAHTWSHGSVVRSWLVELLAEAFDTDPKLDEYTGKVGGGETGKWTLEAAREFGVDAAVMNDAAKARETSMTKPTFSGKVVSALRAGYGGHKEPK
jgi:6-phosphogluconate dehydrogenase